METTFISHMICLPAGIPTGSLLQTCPAHIRLPDGNETVFGQLPEANESVTKTIFRPAARNGIRLPNRKAGAVIKLSEVKTAVSGALGTQKYDMDILSSYIERVVARKIEEVTGYGGFELKKKLQQIMIPKNIDLALSESISFIPLTKAALMLPETQKAMEERGYTGVKAYLYTGRVELSRLLLMSSKYFAALHDNFDTFQYEKRALRTRIVKALIFSLTIASILTVSIFLPPAIGLMPIIIKSGILLAAAAFSVTFFGIIIHALNNFIEDIWFKAKKITFTAFTAKGLEDKLNNYRSSKDMDLESDVKFLLDNKRQIDLLFKKPKAFENGIELKLRLQNLIEAYYLKAIQSNNAGVRDSLLNLIYGFYAVIDSLVLQEALVFGYEKTGNKDIDGIQYEILKFFYVSNAIAFKENYDKANIIYRINNQKRMTRLLFAAGKLEDIEKINSETADGMQNIIFMNTKLESSNFVYKADLQRILNPEQLRKMEIILEDLSNINYLFEDIHSCNIPKQIGYMHIKNIKSKNLLQDILSGNIPAEHRLYALLRLSTVEESPFSLAATWSRFLEGFGRLEEKKITISKDIESELYKESLKILDDASRNEFFIGDRYIDSLEVEMLFTAAAVMLHEKYPNIDIVDFLSQLKFTFVKEDNSTEFIVKYSGSDESEYVQIAMGDKKEYIDSIKDFVESIYKRNTGGETDVNNAKFKSVAKGRPALIKTMRRT
jgi:hypothetical protein